MGDAARGSFVPSSARNTPWATRGALRSSPPPASLPFALRDLDADGRGELGELGQSLKFGRRARSSARAVALRGPASATHRGIAPACACSGFQVRPGPARAGASSGTRSRPAPRAPLQSTRRWPAVRAAPPCAYTPRSARCRNGVASAVAFNSSRGGAGRYPRGPGHKLSFLSKKWSSLSRETLPGCRVGVHREGRAARLLRADNHQTREAAPRRRRLHGVHAAGPGRAPGDARECAGYSSARSSARASSRGSTRASRRPAPARRHSGPPRPGRRRATTPARRPSARAADARARPALADVRVVWLHRAAAAAPRRVLAARRPRGEVRRVARVAEAVALARRARSDA